MRIPLAIALVLGASGAGAAGPVHYLDVINTADSSLVAFAVAPAGTNRFKDFALGDAPLHGGGNSMTLAIGNDDGGCLRDLRATFANGRTLIQQDFNVCKYRSYHTGRYLRRREPVLTASQP
jgi:hypothetical protein